MIKAVLNGWSIMRGLRLAIALMILVQSIIQKDLTLGVVAGFLLLTAITNVGCCGSHGCSVNFSNRKKEKQIVYEELDNKK